MLDHYLEILARKPGALPGSTALAEARASGSFTATHERFWTQARRKLGDGAGTRALIGVILLQRRLAADVVVAPTRRLWSSAASIPRWWPSRPAVCPSAGRRLRWCR